jgi:thiamine-phosphate pyrophosphorylase
MAAQLYLITPVIADAAAFEPRLAALLAAQPVAVVLVRLAAGDERGVIRDAKRLVPVIQQAGAAALIEAPADPRLVARCGADGAHYPADHPQLGEAIADLRPKLIVGVGALASRHAAMEAGERNIDYVMFGEPKPDGFVPDTGRTVERVAWWAPIFTIPCVAYAPDLATVALLAATGAEFIALGPWLFDADDPAQLLRAATRAAADAALPTDRP